MKQRTGAAGESRVRSHTLPNRHRPKPRIDCEAILGNDCANRAQSAYLVCTLPRCSQSKRHNRAVGSCRKLSERVEALGALEALESLGVIGNLGAIGVIIGYMPNSAPKKTGIENDTRGCVEYRKSIFCSFRESPLC